MILKLTKEINRKISVRMQAFVQYIRFSLQMSFLQWRV